MVETNRTVGRITIVGVPRLEMDDVLSFFNEEAAKFHEAMDEGTLCHGCEKEVIGEGVECYCAVEEFGRAHEQYRWCTEDCFNQTHEDYHPDPIPLFDE